MVYVEHVLSFSVNTMVTWHSTISIKPQDADIGQIVGHAHVEAGGDGGGPGAGSVSPQDRGGHQ